VKTTAINKAIACLRLAVFTSFAIPTPCYTYAAKRPRPDAAMRIAIVGRQSGNGR